MSHLILQSPWGENRDIQSHANMWAVPCDGNPECENGEDEYKEKCTVPKELTLFSLIGGFAIIFIAMLSNLVCKKRR